MATSQTVRESSARRRVPAHACPSCSSAWSMVGERNEHGVWLFHCRECAWSRSVVPSPLLVAA